MHASGQVSPGGLVRTAGLAALLVVVAQTSADTDLWGHVRFGQDIVASGQIPSVDGYSFTADRPWINHEWLAEVAMGYAYGLGGPLGLVALKAALAIGALLLVGIPLRDRVPGVWMRASLIAFTILAGVAPLTGAMRPQVFSLLCFAALMVVLTFARAIPRLLWCLPPLFALWVNLHGGWVVGLGVLGVWSAARFLDTPDEDWRWRLTGVGVASVVATLLNPYGLTMWHFVTTTVGVERDDIVEWHALTELPELLIPWSVTTLLALWSIWRLRVVDAGRLAVCLMLAVLSFMVARLLGFYALAVVVLLASLASDGPPRLGARPMPRTVAALVGVVVIVCGVLVQRPALACLQPGPSLGLDPVAMAHLRANAPTGRLLVWFNWGEYAIWHLSPDLQVSIDGRRETVYSQPIIDKHIGFYRNDPTAQDYLTELAPDYAWLPRQLPVSSQLDGWGWRPLVETPQSVVWVRPGLEVPPWRAPLSPARCFP